MKKAFDIVSGHCGSKYKGLISGHIQGKGTIEVNIKCANNLKNIDTGILGDLSDPFVVIKCGSQEFKTRVIDDNLNPVWNETFQFNVDFTSDSQDQYFTVSCFDKNTFAKDAPLGDAKIFIPYLSFAPGKVTPYCVDLEAGEGATMEFGVKFVAS